MASIYIIGNQLIASFVGGEDVNCQNTNVELDVSASHSYCILIEMKVIRKLSKSCQNLMKTKTLSSSNGRALSTVT